MDRDREANTRCTCFTQIGYVHGVKEFSLIVKGLHKYIGSSSHLVSTSECFSLNDIRKYCERMMSIYRREFLVSSLILTLTRVVLWLASDVDTCRAVIGFWCRHVSHCDWPSGWRETLLGPWQYNVDRCSVVSGLVKYGTNNASLSSRVREAPRLGTCKIQAAE